MFGRRQEEIATQGRSKFTSCPVLVPNPPPRLDQHFHMMQRVINTYLYWRCVALERGKVHGPMFGDILPQDDGSRVLDETEPSRDVRWEKNA